jgi:hypothetical protein
MALPTAYLLTTKNLEAFFNALRTAQAPERFTQKFLQDLEFKSTNDRLFIGVLKALGFIDQDGIPQERYYKFLDQTESGAVLAQSVKEAYDDLFRINKQVFNLSEEDVKNKMKTLTRGEKSEGVLTSMAKTFKGLCDLADWSKPETVSAITPSTGEKQQEQTEHLTPPEQHRPKIGGLHYNFEIHLPATRDPAVYDAIFKSLRDHLM